MSSPSRLSRGFLVVVASSAVSAAHAPAAFANTLPIFGAPTTLTSTPGPWGGLGRSVIATNPRGDEIAAWDEAQSNVPPTGWFAARTADGVWSPKALLPAVAGSSEPIRPSGAAMDPSGTATVVGQVDHGIAVVTRQNGVWGVPQVFSAPGKTYDAPILASNGTGDQLLVWQSRSDNATWHTEQTFVAQRQGTGAFSQPLAFDTSFGQSVRASVNARGDAAVAWSDSGSVRFITAKSGQAFSGLRFVGNSAEGDVQALVVTSLGDTFVAWTRQDPNEYQVAKPDLHLRRFTAGGTAGSDQLVAPGDALGYGTSARLVAYDSGAATIVWKERTATQDSIKAADALPNRLLGAPVTIAKLPTYYRGVDAAIADPAGGLLVAWGTTQQERLAWRPSPNAAFEAPTGAGPIGRMSGYGVSSIALSGPGRVSVLGTTQTKLPTGGDAFKLTALRSTRIFGPAPDTTSPVVAIGAVTQVPAAGGGSTVTVKFSLSEGAKATATFSELRPGAWNQYGVCTLLPPGAAAPEGQECQKRVYLTPSPSGWFAKGEREITFARAPKAGSYDLTFTAKDAAGNEGYATKSIQLADSERTSR